jgi:hypothetical protein
VFGVDDEQIEDVLVRTLERLRGRLAVSETGIGAAVSERIKRSQLAERVLAVSETYEQPDDLRRALSIESELPIRELAERAAEVICKDSDAVIGIAIVSYPDMDEHHTDQEEGTALAVYFDGNLRSRAYGFGAQADLAKSWASTWAMSMAWRMLVETFHNSSEQ